MNSMIKIKFCGLTNPQDALAAIEAGADLLGFNFYARSPRSVSVAACRYILNVIRPAMVAHGVQSVGVFVNHPLAQVLEIMNTLRLDLAQLHGNEPPEQVRALRGRGYKALRPRAGEAAVALVEPYVGGRINLTPQPPLLEGEGGPGGQVSAALAHISAGGVLPRSPLSGESGGRGVRGAPPALLLDASVPGQYGGTGQTADWGLAARLAQRCPLLLAGGLHPDNVAAAVAAVQPWGVDAASGVESSPGKKDSAKMNAFVQAVRESISYAYTAS